MLDAASYPTKLVLIGLSVFSIVAVLWLATLATIDSGFSGAIAQTAIVGAEYPWTRAALVDFSLMTAFVSVWIWIRETNAFLSIAFIALLWTFGSAFLGLYVLFFAFKTKGGVSG